MAIRIYSDRIELGDKVIKATPTGFIIGDSRAANTIVTPYYTGANLTAKFAMARSMSFPGEVQGFVAGGGTTPGTDTLTNTIDKFPFASDGNASDFGDLTQARRGNLAGCSAKADAGGKGYAAGGFTGAYSNVIDSWVGGTSIVTDWGDLTSARLDVSGASSRTHGYAFGGAVSNTIDKWSFAQNSNATDVGDLATAVRSSGGVTSPEFGYSIGYTATPPNPAPVSVSVISKFPFATDTNGSSVGNLSQGRFGMGGVSSFTDGYAIGGGNTNPPATQFNTIDKFPFASDTSAVDYGDLSRTDTYQIKGLSSTTHGYGAGGQSTTPPATSTNTIDKFPFAAAANATDVGDLTQARGQGASSQI